MSKVMRQTGHKRTETLDGYIRLATVFKDNSAAYLDLDSEEQTWPEVFPSSRKRSPRHSNRAGRRS